MYEIYVDDELLYATVVEASEETEDTEDAEAAELQILSPKLSLSTEGNDSFSFVLPPGHPGYNSIKRMKSIVTVYQDDVLLFRGRATETARDFYNQKSVYCEGDLSFLADSLYYDEVYNGTAHALFSAMIDSHNRQVEAEKQFEVGMITASGAHEAIEDGEDEKDGKYTSTSIAIRSRLLSAFGGYLRARTSDGVRYIDWIDDFDENGGQDIQFSVNMLDIEDKLDAGDMFTALIPLGYSEMDEEGNYTAPVDITSVNGGRNYIVNHEAVQEHGMIWRTRTWGSTKEPAELLAKAHEYLATGAELHTITMKAIDMHFLDGDIDMLKIGTMVRIVSDPHGLDLRIVCSEMDIDLFNPENTTYIFGQPPQTLSEGVLRSERELNSLTGSADGSGGSSGGGGKNVSDDLKDIIRWANIKVDEANARIELSAGEIDKLLNRVSQAEIDIDGANASIQLKASREEVSLLGKRLSNAEINIDGANAAIQLKASREEVSLLGKRVSNAEINIDGANAAIQLKADRTETSLLGQRVSQAEIDIDGANAAIALKASREEVSLLGERVSTAEINIDGANAAIELKASREEVSLLGERVSQAEINIDGANAAIELKASRDEVSLLGERVSAAEINIDGANAAIELKASRTEVDALGERVTSAEIDIDGANAEIALKVNKNGVISAINVTSEAIKIQASKINLSGYVTASQLSALKTEIGQMLAGTIEASHLYSQQLTVTTTARMLGHTTTWKEMEVVTGVSLKKELTSIPCSDGVTRVVIGSVTVSTSKSTIKYLGR